MLYEVITKSFVFDFYYEAEGQLADITSDDVYGCAGGHRDHRGSNSTVG